MRLLREVVIAAEAVARAYPARSGAPLLSSLYGHLTSAHRTVAMGAVLDTVRCPLLVVSDDGVVVVASAYAGTRQSIRRDIDDWVFAGADGVVMLVSRRRLMVGAPVDVDGVHVRFVFVGPERFGVEP